MTGADGETVGVVVTTGTGTTELLVVGPAGVTAIEVAVELAGTFDSAVHFGRLFAAKAAGESRLAELPTARAAMRRITTPCTLEKLRTVFFP